MNNEHEKKEKSVKCETTQSKTSSGVTDFGNSSANRKV